EHDIIRKSISTGGITQLEQVIQIVQNSGALEYCRARAEQETQAALDALNQLPDSEARQALTNLTLMALHRIQ
ncbi:MAG TPA: geranylgeranyl diphosphate synthase, partial [Acinetobacter ursingii]|nr:geranylgeranyl diphosphate synthase [Acinetobacter ursingii]